MFRISLYGLICVLLGGLTSNTQSQDYPSWRTAVEAYFPDEDLLVHSRDVRVTFKRPRRHAEPDAEITYTYRMESLREEAWEYPHTIVFDSRSQITKLSVGRKRFKPSKLDVSDYTNGELVHSDVELGKVAVRFNRKHKERRVSYTVELTDLRYLPPLFMVEPNAVFSSALTVEIPHWLELEVIPYQMKDDLKYHISDTRNDRNTRIYSINSYSFEPAFRLADSPGPSHIYPNLLLVPREFTSRKLQRQTMFNSVQDLYSWYRKLVQEVDNQWFKVDDELSYILNLNTNDDTKLSQIYHWVQENIRYLAFEDGMAGYRPQSPSKVYSNGYSDCKGTAMLLRHLLIRAGYDARLCWMSTAHLAYSYDQPSLAADNHMICAVITPDDTVFLDATDKYANYGALHPQVADRPVLMEDGSNYIRTRTPGYKRMEDEMRLSSDTRITMDGSIRGSTRLEAKGLGKEVLMSSVLPSRIKWSGLKSTLTDDVNFKILPEDDYWRLWSADDETIQMEFQFETTLKAGLFNGDLLLPMSYLGLYTPPPIDHDRSYAVVLPQHHNYLHQLSLDIPEGYIVGELPEPLVIDQGPLQAEITYQIEPAGIKVDYQLHFPEAVIPQDQFQAWSAAHRQLMDALATPLTFHLDLTEGQ